MVARVTGNLAPVRVFLAFFVGGVFGVLGASLLESDLHASTWIYFRVGLIEEFIKTLILPNVGRQMAPKTARQGALLGAGFAAFESAGSSAASTRTWSAEWGGTHGSLPTASPPVPPPAIQ